MALQLVILKLFYKLQVLQIKNKMYSIKCISLIEIMLMYHITKSEVTFYLEVNSILRLYIECKLSYAQKTIILTHGTKIMQ